MESKYLISIPTFSPAQYPNCISEYQEEGTINNMRKVIYWTSFIKQQKTKYNT